MSIFSSIYKFFGGNDNITLKPKPKTKLKPIYDKKCKTDIHCIHDKDSFKPTIKDIYHKPESFGFMIDLPNEAPFTKKDFKVKCKGLKVKKKYDKEPIINKKTFGFLMPKLNNSLYFPRQEENSCYNTNKVNIRKNLSLGKTCYKDLECESKNCSNIFKFPGKCINPKNTSKIFKGQKCNYEKDCKKNLSCVNNVCVKKPTTVRNTILINKTKKKNKGVLGKTVNKYTPNF